jgi:DNA integrity scanning protein DisA with diadenylate cyclase activity
MSPPGIFRKTVTYDNAIRTKIIASLKDICTEQWRVNPRTLEATIILAIEIAREGREGRKVGAHFVISDTDRTMRNSRCLILDPLQHHPEDAKYISEHQICYQLLCVLLRSFSLWKLRDISTGVYRGRYVEDEGC